jgi:O-acetyl-ADP-ribose deacetylase (regulator of RNase III)
MNLGDVDVIELEQIDRTICQTRFVINFPTKHHWKDSSTIDDIETGLTSLITNVIEHDIKSISIPALGCGCGGLSWNIVSNVMLKTLSSLPDDIDVFVYSPS